MGSVMFVDETTGGGRGDGWAMEIAEQRLALRELIRRRVHRERAQSPAERSAALRRPVPPAAAGGAPVDPEAQTAIALAFFERGGFLVLVGDRQVTGLDEQVDLPPGTEVTFLRLLALVGG
ncbi:hypothetical protein [Streptomyces sp. NPDC091268]|uniref:hypothetical protein n=1 Tax=Streptomyces sp. NPDC091268 TaxID=3365979 RepID=UPI003814C903